MTLNYVSLTVDLYDGLGNPASSGQAIFTPSAQLTDTTNHEIVTLAPIPVTFKPGQGPPAVKLLATDNATLLPNGWAWNVSFVGVPGNPASFNFFLPFASGANQNLSSQAPVSTVATQSAQWSLLATTGIAGFAKQNNNNVVIWQWTAPNDGAMHTFLAILEQKVTVTTEVGGIVQLQYKYPDGSTDNRQPYGGGASVGINSQSPSDNIPGGTTVTLIQTTALSGGAVTTIWGTLWGA